MTAWGSAESLKHNLMAVPVLDGEGVHYEFSGGGHGKKLLLGPERVPTDSREYKEMVEALSRLIRVKCVGKYMGLVTLMGIADGAIDLAEDVAANLGMGVDTIPTVKTKDKRVILPEVIAEEMMARARNEARIIIGIDDVGTTGSNMMPPLMELRQMGYEQLIALYVWLRSLDLPYLDVPGFMYDGVINDSPVDTYYPDQEICPQCLVGEELIAH